MKLFKDPRFLWITMLAVLLLLVLGSLLAGSSPRVTALLLMLTLLPLGKLLPAEYLLITAVFVIPLAPHTMLFSEQLPSMTINLPYIAMLGVLFLYAAIRQGQLLKEMWLLIGCWAAFALLVIISWLFAGSSNYAELFAINNFVFFGALLVLAAAMNPDIFDFKRVCRAFYAAAFVVALFGLAQYFFSTYLISDWYVNAFMKFSRNMDFEYRIADRVLSTFGNPHTVGMYLGIMLMFALGSNFSGFNRSWTKLLWVAVLVAAIILTRSRTTYICLAIGYVYLLVFFNRSGLKYLICSMGVFALIFGVLTRFLPPNWLDRLFNYHQTVDARFDLWAMATERFLASPLLGAGPNPGIYLAGSAFTKPIDNVYLTILASYGLFGFAVLLGLLYLIITQLIKIAETDFKLRYVVRGVGCGLLMLLVASLSGDFLLHPKLMGAYLLLLGCLFVAYRQKAEPPSKVMLVGNAKSIHIQRWGNSLAQRGLVVHVLSPEAQSISGCHVHRINYTAMNIFSVGGIVNLCKIKWQVERKIKEIAPDLVHIHGLFPFGWYASYFTGGPLMATVWGSDVYQYATSSWRKKMLVKGILNRADLVTVPTKEVGSDVDSILGYKQSQVLFWGIDDNVFYHSREDGREIQATRESLKIPDNAKLVLSPRSIAPIYNIEAIIKAIPRVVSRTGHDIVFCFLRGAGNDAYEAQMISKAVALGVKKHTRWVTEFQKPEDMACLFRAADVFVSVPETDNLGITIMEGLACGSIPVVKRLRNYQYLYDTGAVIITVSEVTPDDLARAMITALRVRTGETAVKNSSAALILSTWRESVDKMLELYVSLGSGCSIEHRERGN